MTSLILFVFATLKIRTQWRPNISHRIFFYQIVNVKMCKPLMKIERPYREQYRSLCPARVV